MYDHGLELKSLHIVQSNQGDDKRFLRFFSRF